jgi:phosphate/sulfate permease
MPVSTTHAITASIMGVGCAKGFNNLKLTVVERIVWLVLTIPRADWSHTFWCTWRVSGLLG